MDDYIEMRVEHKIDTGVLYGLIGVTQGPKQSRHTIP